MLLAELEIRHSRPVAPTRRVALGRRLLPVDPAPGWGGVLLGGLVAVHAADLDVDDTDLLFDLIDDLEAGRRIAQPRLRHRLQVDTVGLDRSRHSLFGEGDRVYFDFDGHARPAVHVLGAAYAAATLPVVARPLVFRAIRKAVAWDAPLGPDFVAYLLGGDAPFSRWRALPVDERWACLVLGFGVGDEPSSEDVQARFRELIRQVHPDLGGDVAGAGQRVVELTHARRILLRRRAAG
jgi:hypothetical protein